MFKKSFILVMAVALIVAMFTGCGYRGGSNVRINENDITQFSAIDVATSSTRIELVAADRYGIDIFVPERFAPEWGVTDGRLTIRDKTNRFDLGWGIFPRNYYVKVFYPAGTEFTDITLESASGRIELSNAEVADLKITSSSGRINARAENFDNASIGSASGAVTFSGSGGYVGIASHSGSVQAEAGDFEAISVATGSGRVTLTGEGDTATVLSVKTMSGRIDATGGAWQDVTTRTSSGSTTISGELSGNINIETSSGSVRVNVSGSPSGFGYSLTTGSGSIRWNGERMGNPAHSSGSFEDNIAVSTMSGGIRVDFSKN